jgi:hypothetical protein
MPGDGVSLPTSLAQMGNVAKTQARGQQTAPQVTPFSEQKDGQDELKVQRVNETTEAEKNRVTRRDEEKDKRKRRRLKRFRKKANIAEEEYRLNRENSESCEGEDQAPDTEEETLGALIDLRV